MIRILPADREALPALCTAHALPFDTVGMQLWEGTDCTGYVLYRLQGGILHLYRLCATDSLLRDGLLRAALHAGELQGATEAVCAYAPLWDFLCACGFAKNENAAEINLCAFFSRSCNHCN